MNYDRLYQLVDKYLNGASSVVEEQELQYYLLHEDVPENLLPLKSQFLAFQEFSKTGLSNTFEQSFWEAVNTDIKTVTDDSHSVGTSFGNKRSFYYLLSGVAATLLILLTIWTTTDIFKIKHPINQYNNPALAYRQATDALSLLAINFDKGLSKTQQAAKPLNTSLKMLDNVGMINKGLESLQPMSKIDNMEIIKYNNNH